MILLNLMNAFGWSNIIEAILFLVIALKHRDLAPLALLLTGLFVPLAGLTNSLANVSLGGADWSGQYFMMFLYLPLCLLPVIIYYFQKFRNSQGLTHD